MSGKNVSARFFAHAARWCAAIVVLTVMTFGLAACDGGNAPNSSASHESPSPTQLPSVTVVAAESIWGLIAAQIGGAHVEVTSLMDDTTQDTSMFTPTADQKAQIADADMVLVTGAGYDTWAVEQTSREQSIISAASAVGAATGDNPYLWYSHDVREAVAESINDALVKLRPDWASYFNANLADWEDEEAAVEKKIDALASRLTTDASYVAFVPVGSYLFSEMGLKDATPAAYSAQVLRGQTPDAAGRAALTEALDGAAFVVEDSQHPVNGVNAIAARATSLKLPVVTLPELPAADDKETATSADWLTGIVDDMDDALEPLTAASASPSPSPSASRSLSASSSPSVSSR